MGVLYFYLFSWTDIANLPMDSLVLKHYSMLLVFAVWNLLFHCSFLFILCSGANQERCGFLLFEQDFQKNRISRSSVFPTANAYSQPEDSSSQEMISTVERTMKKYTDNIMRFLEGISSRLSQLELYCYNLDKSIGEMRSDLVRDHREDDSKLKSLEKHLQEVSYFF